MNKSILATLMVFIFCVSLISGCATLTPWMFKGKVALKEYNGEFKQTLVQGKQYLESNYSIDFYVDIYKEDSDKRDIVRNSWFFGIWGKPGMDLNDIHMANEAWMRDFNRVADAWGLPHLENTQDNALFLMFHEFRHILQLKDKADDFHTLEMTDELRRGINTYRFRPRESDADWFALTEVKKFKGRV